MGYLCQPSSASEPKHFLDLAAEAIEQSERRLILSQYVCVEEPCLCCSRRVASISIDRKGESYGKRRVRERRYPRERPHTSRANAECLPDRRVSSPAGLPPVADLVRAVAIASRPWPRPHSGSPRRDGFCGPHTMRPSYQTQASAISNPLPARPATQRATRARTLRFTSSHARPEAGFVARFVFRHASSCFCHSWTGTAPGSDARSSHRSSTSWSFSAALSSKIDAAFIRISIL